MLAVCNNPIILDTVILILHRYQAISRKQGERAVIHLRNGYLTVTILNRHQIDEFTFLRIADEAIGITMHRNSKWIPVLQKGDMDTVTLQTISIGTENGVAPHTGTTKYQGIILTDTEDMRASPASRHIFNIREVRLAIEHLDAVIMIPVAGDDHPSAVPS